MKFCKDCKYYESVRNNSSEYITYLTPFTYMCNYPIPDNIVGYNIINGDRLFINSKNKTCDFFRTGSDIQNLDICGYEGKYWEAK